MADNRYAKSAAADLIPLLRSLGVKRTACIRLGGNIDIPLADNTAIPAGQLVFETILTPTVSVTHRVGGAVNWFRHSFTHSFAHSNLRFWVITRSNRLTPDTSDNDAGPPGIWINTSVITTIDAVVDVCYEPLNDGGRS